MNYDPNAYSARPPQSGEPPLSDSRAEERAPEETGETPAGVTDFSEEEEIEDVEDSEHVEEEDALDADEIEETDDVEEGDAEEDDLYEEDEEDEASDALNEALEEMRATLGTIHEEVANASTENRRNSRRVFDILKQFGTVLEALSVTINSLHASTRAAATPAEPTARGTTPPLDIIELSDRVDRIATALTRAPQAARPWWPPARRTHDRWMTDRERLADSFTILSTHVRSLLAKAGLERIPCANQTFDPTSMTAVEAVLRSDLADHTVVEELLPGWRLAGGEPGASVIRPAQVRVSRAQ